MAVDPVTITATIAAVSAGVDLIDKIYGKIVRVLTDDQEVTTRPEEHGLQKLETRRDEIVFNDHGQLRTITAADLAALPPEQLSLVRMYEKSMENKAAIFESVYPDLDLEADPVRKAQIKLRLKEIVDGMSQDLTGILDFLRTCGLQLDDHYSRIRHLVAQHSGRQ